MAKPIIKISNSVFIGGAFYFYNAWVSIVLAPL